MAEKKIEKKLERTYIIPIRKSTVKTARWRRANKAMTVIRKFMKRHMKSDNVKIGQELNELIWERGGKYVPGKVEVNVLKEDDVVRVNILGAPLPSIEVKEEKKEETKTKKTKEVKEDKKEETKELKEEAKAENEEAEPAAEKEGE